MVSIIRKIEKDMMSRLTIDKFYVLSMEEVNRRIEYAISTDATSLNLTRLKLTSLSKDIFSSLVSL